MNSEKLKELFIEVAKGRYSLSNYGTDPKSMIVTKTDGSPWNYVQNQDIGETFEEAKKLENEINDLITERYELLIKRINLV